MSIEKLVSARGRVTYKVRYRGPNGRQRSKAFDRRRDAQSFESELRAQLRAGAWVDPQGGHDTLLAMWRQYENDVLSHLRATTRANYRSAWRLIEQDFGDWQIRRITHADVASWVARISAERGPDRVRYTYRVLSLVLDHAVRLRKLVTNEARGVRLPRARPSQHRYLTVDQVHDLAEAMPAGGGDVVLAMAYLGLRFSEVAALTAGDVDLAARRVHVTRRVTEVGGHLDVSRPKSRASERYIAVPATIAAMLERRTAGQPRDHLVFPSPEGTYLRNGNWRRRSGFNEGVKTLGLDGTTPHDLRRTFGSLARAAGADLRYIQKAMGHESVTTTARIYAHLYDTELDQVSDALDRLARLSRGGCAEKVP